MIYLLYGPDTYRSLKKTNEIIQEYQKKAGGGFNLHRFDGEDEDLSLLRKIIESNSLFAARKLIVAQNILSYCEDFESIKLILKPLRGLAETILILLERESDEKTKKRIQEIDKLFDKSQEFLYLGREALSRWVSDEAKKRGVKLYPAGLASLSSFGSNLWALSNELDKMALLQQSATSHQSSFNNVQERTVFELGDTFFSQKKEGLRTLLNLLHQGHDDFNLFSYLSNHARTLFIVKSHIDGGKIVSTKYGIHPYVVKKAASIVKPLPTVKLRIILRRFFDEDYKIKIGIKKPQEALEHILMDV